MFVKPANLGSSVGISKVKRPEELGPAIALAAEFDRKIVVEAAVPAAREIECSVLGNDRPEASVPGEILPTREFYDYEAKYLEESQALIPAPARRGAGRRTSGAWRARPSWRWRRPASRASTSCCRATPASLYVNEINTIPGFTTISMFPKLWEATGLAYPEVLDRLIELAFERHAGKQSLRTSYP